MARSNLRIKVQGADAAIRKAGLMRDELIKAIDKDVERTTKEAINDARKNAPVRDSHLVNSINEIRQERGEMKRVFGSDRPYARRQEYEHKSKRGFFRKAVWNARAKLRDRVNNSIKRIGR